MIIPETMQAVCIEKPEGPMSVKTVRVPKPGKGEVLVKISAAPVNPSDFQKIKSINSDKLHSFIPGLEGSGLVVAAGSGILPGLLKGKRVACSSSSDESGTWAEYMVTSAASCFPLPGSVTDEQGSMLLVNPLTALAFFDIIKKEKHSAVINSAAAGALGKMIIHLAKRRKISLINVVKNQVQGNSIRLLEAENILRLDDPEFAGKLKSLANRLNATLALDPISGEYTSVLLEAIPYGGTVLLYGHLSGEDHGVVLRPLLTDNKKLHGFYLVNWISDNGLLSTVMNLFRARKLLKNQVVIKIQKRIPLEEVQSAVDKYRQNMSAGKVLIIPGMHGTIDAEIPLQGHGFF